MIGCAGSTPTRSTLRLARSKHGPRAARRGASWTPCPARASPVPGKPRGRRPRPARAGCLRTAGRRRSRAGVARRRGHPPAARHAVPGQRAGAPRPVRRHPGVPGHRAGPQRPAPADGAAQTVTCLAGGKDLTHVASRSCCTYTRSASWARTKPRGCGSPRRSGCRGRHDRVHGLSTSGRRSAATAGNGRPPQGACAHPPEPRNPLRHSGFRLVTVRRAWDSNPR